MSEEVKAGDRFEVADKKSHTCDVGKTGVLKRVFVKTDIEDTQEIHIGA